MLGFEGYVLCIHEGAVLQHQAIPVSLQSFELTEMLRKYLPQLLLPNIYREVPGTPILLQHNCLMQSNLFLYLEVDGGAACECLQTAFWVNMFSPECASLNQGIGCTLYFKLSSEHSINSSSSMNVLAIRDYEVRCRSE